MKIFIVLFTAIAVKALSTGYLDFSSDIETGTNICIQAQ